MLLFRINQSRICFPVLVREGTEHSYLPEAPLVPVLRTGSPNFQDFGSSNNGVSRAGAYRKQAKQSLW